MWADGLRSHMGWLLDSDGTKIRRNKKNASDLSPGPQKTQFATPFFWEVTDLLPLHSADLRLALCLGGTSEMLNSQA